LIPTSPDNFALPQIEASKNPAASRSSFVSQCCRTTFARKYEFFGFAEPSGDIGGDLVDVVGDDAGWVGCWC